MINLSNGRKYFREEFVEEFEKTLQECKDYDEFLFIHGTVTKEEAEAICRLGLIQDYPELYNTAEFCVPKNSGKGGLPIWKQIYNINVKIV